MKKDKEMNKNKIYGEASYKEQGKTLIKISVGVILILGLVYLLTALATGEIKLNKKEEEKEEVKIQYEEIIAGQILNRMSEEYYVLVYNFTDSNSGYYNSLKEGYSQSTEALPFYMVDLENPFNKTLVVGEGEEYSKNPTNVSELKAINPTLLKVKKNKVTSRIEGEDEVMKELEKIAK